MNFPTLLLPRHHDSHQLWPRSAPEPTTPPAYEYDLGPSPASSVEMYDELLAKQSYDPPYPAYERSASDPGRPLSPPQPTSSPPTPPQYSFSYTAPSYPPPSNYLPPIEPERREYYPQFMPSSFPLRPTTQQSHPRSLYSPNWAPKREDDPDPDSYPSPRRDSYDRHRDIRRDSDLTSRRDSYSARPRSYSARRGSFHSMTDSDVSDPPPQEQPSPLPQPKVKPQREPTPPPASAGGNKTYSFVSLAGNAVRKRPRRRYDEIERLYGCSWPECTKAYGTLNHLNAHVSMQRHGLKRSPSEFKELRKMWRRQKKEEASNPKPTSPPGKRRLHRAKTSSPPLQVSQPPPQVETAKRANSPLGLDVEQYGARFEQAPPARYDEQPAARYEQPPARYEEPPVQRYEPTPARYEEPPTARYENPPTRYEESPSARYDPPPSGGRYEEPQSGGRYEEPPSSASNYWPNGVDVQGDNMGYHLEQQQPIVLPALHQNHLPPMSHPSNLSLSQQTQHHGNHVAHQAPSGSLSRLPLLTSPLSQSYPHHHGGHPHLSPIGSGHVPTHLPAIGIPQGSSLGPPPTSSHPLNPSHLPAIASLHTNSASPQSQHSTSTRASQHSSSIGEGGGRYV